MKFAKMTSERILYLYILYSTQSIVAPLTLTASVWLLCQLSSTLFVLFLYLVSPRFVLRKACSYAKRTWR